jgi:hypothetical protein
VKGQLEHARATRDRAALQAIETSLEPLDAAEYGVLVDLFLSYRALGKAEDYEAMCSLYKRLPGELQHSVMVREQYAFALNRLKRRNEAIRVLKQVLAGNGPSSETLGLLGRIDKDLWDEARKAGRIREAAVYSNLVLLCYKC